MWLLKVFKELEVKSNFIFTLIQWKSPQVSIVTNHRAIQHCLSNIYSPREITVTTVTVNLTLTILLTRHLANHLPERWCYSMWIIAVSYWTVPKGCSPLIALHYLHNNITIVNKTKKGHTNINYKTSSCIQINLWPFSMATSMELNCNLLSWPAVRAPFSSNILTTATWPSSQALKSGVWGTL